jgi:hypothetical protein
MHAPSADAGFVSLQEIHIPAFNLRKDGSNISIFPLTREGKGDAARFDHSAALFERVSARASNAEPTASRCEPAGFPVSIAPSATKAEGANQRCESLQIDNLTGVPSLPIYSGLRGGMDTAGN